MAVAECAASGSNCNKSNTLLAAAPLPFKRGNLLNRIVGLLKELEAGINLTKKTTFENVDLALPVQPSGYYKELTVSPPPGSSGRGNERLVVGVDSGGVHEVYYTNDHYAPGSFVRIK
jgi:guanyl-specific ribonuclease Sa